MYNPSIGYSSNHLMHVNANDFAYPSMNFGYTSFPVTGDKSEELVKQIESRLHTMNQNDLSHLRGLLNGTLGKIDFLLYGAPGNMPLSTLGPSAYNSLPANQSFTGPALSPWFTQPLDMPPNTAKSGDPRGSFDRSDNKAHRGHAKRIRRSPTNLNKDGQDPSYIYNNRSKAELRGSQGAGVPSASKADFMLAPSIEDTAAPECEGNTSIDLGIEQAYDLQFILNAKEYHEKLDKLELDTALFCGLDQFLPYLPDSALENSGPYSSFIECVEALRGCINALINLQREGFCDRTFTILVEDPSRPDVAEAVHVSLEEMELLVTSLSAMRTSRRGNKTTAHILSLSLIRKLQGRHGRKDQDRDAIPQFASHKWLPSLRFLCTALSIGLVSFSGSHACRFDSIFCSTPLDKIPVGFGLNFTLRKLACLEDFIGGPAWVLGRNDPIPSPDTGMKVSLTVQDFEHLWGPVWPFGRTPDKTPIIKTERGFIVPLSSQSEHEMTHDRVPYELEFHWTKELPHSLVAIERPENLLLNSARRILIGTATGKVGLTVNDKCQTQIGLIQQQIASQLQIPGAYRGHYVGDGYEVNLGGGEYVTGGITKKWKKIPARTQKSALIEICDKPNTRLMPLLKLQVGLEISACTGNARRISLWDAICISQKRGTRSKDGVANSLNPCEHGIGDINCISSCWVNEENEGIDCLGNRTNEQKVLSGLDARRRIIDCIKLFEYTGIDHDGSLQAWWPFTDTPLTCRISPVTTNDVTNWFRLIKDTRDTSAFPIVSQRCFEIRAHGNIQKCSRPCKNGHSRIAQTGLSTRIMLDPLWLPARGSRNQQRNNLTAKTGLVQGTKLMVGDTHLTIETEWKGEQPVVVAAISTNPLYYKLGVASRLLLEGKTPRAQEQINHDVTTGVSIPIIVY